MTPERRRWFVFAVLACAYALVAIYRLSTAVLSESLAVAFDASGAELGTLHAMFFVVYALLQLPAGVVADRAGARWSVAGGTVTFAVGGLAFALAPSYPMALAARALIGVGASFLFIAILRFCANWFRPGEFARMSGLTIAVAGFGGILATTPLALAVTAFGWRETMTGVALLGLLLAVLVVLVARDSPADAGYEPIHGVPTPEAPRLREVAGNVRRVLREPETWLAGLVLFAGTGINVTVFGLWGVPYVVQTYGLPVTGASTFTLLGSAGLLVGPPVVGAISDRLGRRTEVIVTGMGLYMGAFALLALLGDPPLAVVGVCFFAGGFLAGAYALSYAVVKERHPAAASGVSTGTINTIGFTGAAVLPTAMGLILDSYATGRTIGGAPVYSVAGYRVAFALAAGVAFVAFCCAVGLHVRG
ncbi:MFS transporter [Natronomonas sp. EA1]|uniref:MFS transporter n=1 Tax=Natronomonas sp. EA1 TaxID=3421655 RepID=UPI003EBB6D54